MGIRGCCAALNEQAARLAVTSRAFYTDRLPPFLARLCELTGMDRALPMSTGAEASRPPSRRRASGPTW